MLRDNGPHLFHTQIDYFFLSLALTVAKSLAYQLLSWSHLKSLYLLPVVVFLEGWNLVRLFTLNCHAGAGPRETIWPPGLAEDQPASVLHTAGGARAPPHSRQQQEQEQQTEAPHDLCMALSVTQSLRGPGLQIQRPPAPCTHHRQVCHSQEDRLAG